MKRLFLLVAVLAVIVTTQAQEELTTDIITYTNSIISNLPDAKANDDYVEPTTEQLNIFADVISYMVEKDFASAHQRAADINYKVVKITDNSGEENKDFYMLKNNGNNHWGVYVFNDNPGREKLVIQSPHPKYDAKTGNQGIFILRNTDSYVFFLAGTHRCNSSQPSPCSGTTSACSSTYESFRRSDQAHNASSTFQKATEVLEAKKDSLIYFQFHGFTKGDSDPYIIMSNGTTNTPEYTDYLSILSQELLEIDPYLTFKIAHIDDWTRLIATTNVQGRLLNGSSDPCSLSASRNSGRFIHLEQEYSRLRKYQSGWQKMVDAINNIFPSSNATSIEQETEIPTDYALGNHPNPFNPSTVITYQLPESAQISLKIYDLLGREVTTLVDEYRNAGKYQSVFTTTDLTSGIYIYALRVNSQNVSKKMVLLK